MTKFQVYPRPRKTIQILRRQLPGKFPHSFNLSRAITLPFFLPSSPTRALANTDEQLPKYARRKRPWDRQNGFNYKILDQVGDKGGGGTSSSGAGEGQATSPRSMDSLSHTHSTPYSQHAKRVSNVATGRSYASQTKTQPKQPPKVQAAPPMFSSAPTSPPPSMSQAGSGGPPRPPQVPGGPPRPPGGGGPPRPPAVPGGGGPPRPPAVPGGGGPPPVPGGPPIPPVPGGGGGAPPEELAPYLRMKKMGVPMVGIQNKMRVCSLLFLFSRLRYLPFIGRRIGSFFVGGLCLSFIDVHRNERWVFCTCFVSKCLALKLHENLA